ncbi:MAG: DUF523 domain-containing protein [Myxococcales bacterium]|nr:DUF523 domain-containing protein [Myxococcales bacterium]
MVDDTMARVAVSSCLLGEPVRWDGGHKRDGFVTDILASLVEIVPVCPEVELGMGTPRPPVDLVRVGASLRMLGQGGADHTEAMARFSSRRLDELGPVDGWVFKAGSPSCGVDQVPVRGEGGGVARDGRGLFAAAVRERFPLLPIEDESGLADPARRASFLARVLAHRWQRGLAKEAQRNT